MSDRDASDEVFEAVGQASAQVWRDLLDAPGWTALVEVLERRRAGHLSGLDSSARTRTLEEVRGLQGRRDELQFVIDTPMREIRRLGGTTTTRRPEEVTRGR